MITNNYLAVEYVNISRRLDWEVQVHGMIVRGSAVSHNLCSFANVVRELTVLSCIMHSLSPCCNTVVPYGREDQQNISRTFGETDSVWFYGTGVSREETCQEQWRDKCIKI